MFSCTPKENGDFYFEEEAARHVPGDWFFLQRAFPSGKIDHQAYYRAIQEKKGQVQSRDLESWEPVGPTNIGGRITDVEVHPDAPEVIFFGAAAGGVFRSTDDDEHWEPVFDDAANLSIGDIAIAPDNPNSIYVGTGEANGGGNSLSYDGNGVFHSNDGGNNWISLGLTNVGGIGKVDIDPKRPERLYVAAMGRLFENTPERGVYRSLDGGQLWEKVLFLTDSTGAIDLVINPLQPDTIYAAMWERIRELNRRSYGGESTGIYRSTDGGDSWVPLVNGLPNAGPRKGRIGLTISPSSPNILYAIFATQTGNLEGIYKTEDHGESWSRINTNGVTSVSFMWWFGKIQVDPKDPEIIYVPGLNIVKTLNGGGSWFEVFYNTHVDQHAIWIHPENTNIVWLGNDGGLYKSTTGGSSYTKIAPLPITQLYAANIDPNFPGRLYAGAQDNGVMRTPAGLLDDWEILINADGFTTLLDPTDDQFVLTEYQFGNLFLSLDGGQSFNNVTPYREPGNRNNWHSPLAMSPQNPNTIYFGREKVFRSLNRGLNWEIISPDLTGGPTGGNLAFGTLTSISLSIFDPGLIYTGSDDGHVWVSKNGGTEWTDISAGLPQRWVTKVAASPLNESTVYVTLSGYKSNSNAAHVYKSVDFGQQWVAIDENLPDIPVNDIEINPETGDLYIATDIGVFYSENDGGTWEALGDGLPNVVVSDLVYYPDSLSLYAATYGRSIFKYTFSQATSTQLPKEKKLAFQFFPNPARTNITVRLNIKEQQQIRLRLKNIKGQLLAPLLEVNLPKGKHELPVSLSHLRPGVYILHLRSTEGMAFEKIIIQ